MSETTAKAVAVLRAAYPRQDFPDESVRLYVRMLADLDGDAVARAIGRLVKGSRFMPSIAEIREQVSEETLALPTAEQAWDIVVRGDLNAADDLVRAAATAAGGRWRILHTENVETVRAQFVKDYTARRARAVVEESGGAVALIDRPSVASVMLDQAAAITPSLLASVPQTTRINPRPLMARWFAEIGRHDGWGTPSWPVVFEERPATDDEKRDAISVLRDFPADDPLSRVALAVLDRG